MEEEPTFRMKSEVVGRASCHVCGSVTYRTRVSSLDQTGTLFQHSISSCGSVWQPPRSFSERRMECNCTCSDIMGISFGIDWGSTEYKRFGGNFSDNFVHPGGRKKSSCPAKVSCVRQLLTNDRFFVMSHNCRTQGNCLFCCLEKQTD